MHDIIKSSGAVVNVRTLAKNIRNMTTEMVKVNLHFQIELKINCGFSLHVIKIILETFEMKYQHNILITL